MRIKTTSSFTTFRALIMLGLFGFLFSCTKSNSGGGGTTSTLTSFSFEVANNPIPVTSAASVTGGNINIFLPPGTNVNALVASFTLSDSAIVRVNGTTQQSGVTANNFSNPLTYT